MYTTWYIQLSDCQGAPGPAAYCKKVATHRHGCIAHVTLTLTLTRWPWYTILTWRFWRCTCTPKMNFCFQLQVTALRTDRQTDATERIASPHSLVIKNRLRLVEGTVRYRLPRFYGPPCIRALCNAFCTQEESVISHKSLPVALGAVRITRRRESTDRPGRCGGAGRAAARGAASRRACVPSGRYVDGASRRSAENTTTGSLQLDISRTQSSGARS